MKFKSNLFTISLFIIIILIFLFLIFRREEYNLGGYSKMYPPTYVKVEIVGPYLFGPDALNHNNCQPWTDSVGAGVWIYENKNHANSLFTKLNLNSIDPASGYKDPIYLGLTRSKDLHGTNDNAQRLILYAKRGTTFGFSAKPGRNFSYAWQEFVYTTDQNIVSIKILTGNRNNKGKMKPFFIYMILNFDGTTTRCISY